MCALAVTGYEINKAYLDSFARVSEQDVDLNEYRPFIENTKAVTLQDPSALKIEGELPRLDGATALYPLYSAKATYPRKEYHIYNSEVMSNQTAGAYENLIKGRVDIIFAASPSKHQLEDAKRRGVELTLTPIGREAFVFFVNSKNNVDGFSTTQIQDIYSGIITNWKELGGHNGRIRAFQRPENSGSQTMLQKLMEGKVDGIYPVKNNIKNKEYPLAVEFYAVTAGSENPNIEPFIEWILSSQGQSLVDKTGYISLENNNIDQ
jgi:phosphate transport system substrate-binding protein